MGTVTVFTKPSCVQCTATYRALKKDGIPHQSVDLTVDETALDQMKALGFQQAPVVVHTDADGNVVDSWSGFNPTKIEELKVLAAADRELASV